MCSVRTGEDNVLPDVWHAMAVKQQKHGLLMTLSDKCTIECVEADLTLPPLTQTNFRNKIIFKLIKLRNDVEKHENMQEELIPSLVLLMRLVQD